MNRKIAGRICMVVGVWGMFACLGCRKDLARYPGGGDFYYDFWDAKGEYEAKANVRHASVRDGAKWHYEAEINSPILIGCRDGDSTSSLFATSGTIKDDGYWVWTLSNGMKLEAGHIYFIDKEDTVKEVGTWEFRTATVSGKDWKHDAVGTMLLMDVLFRTATWSDGPFFQRNSTDKDTPE